MLICISSNMLYSLYPRNCHRVLTIMFFLFCCLLTCQHLFPSWFILNHPSEESMPCSHLQSLKPATVGVHRWSFTNANCRSPSPVYCCGHSICTGECTKLDSGFEMCWKDWWFFGFNLASLLYQTTIYRPNGMSLILPLQLYSIRRDTHLKSSRLIRRYSDGKVMHWYTMLYV